MYAEDLRFLDLLQPEEGRSVLRIIDKYFTASYPGRLGYFPPSLLEPQMSPDRGYG